MGSLPGVGEKMLVEIDVETGQIVGVFAADINGNKIGEAATVSDDEMFNRDPVTKETLPDLELPKIRRCDNTSILATENSPRCVWIYQRGIGWRQVCFP